ncbi:hypothetical protein ACIHDR_25350 [Nocardia sp. NPDC052278]|uniref:hypothetical protein n=1 Tax=unclassified Nocardia TaxID=2637762 RepID=UPI00367AB0AD
MLGVFDGHVRRATEQQAVCGKYNGVADTGEALGAARAMSSVLSMNRPTTLLKYAET